MEYGKDSSAAPPLSPRIARMKERLIDAPYEICMARAYHFTRAYKKPRSSILI